MTVEDIIRQNGAVPATIAIIEGRIKIGWHLFLRKWELTLH